MRASLRVAAAAALCVPLTLAAAATRSGGASPGCAEAAGLHHVALVVEHASGTTVKACVAFSAGSLTGDQVLAMSQVEYATVDFAGAGKAVCQIDGEPASYPPGCWTASSPYWALYVSRGGRGWTSSSLGISSQTFADGDAEGFRYEGQSDTSPPASPAGVCPPASVSTPTPSSVAVSPHLTPRPVGGATAAPPASAGAAAPSPTVAAQLSPTGTTTPVPAAIAQRGGTPPARPGRADPLAWLIAAAAATVTLVGLALRLARNRRRPGEQPST